MTVFLTKKYVLLFRQLALVCFSISLSNCQPPGIRNILLQPPSEIRNELLQSPDVRNELFQTPKEIITDLSSLLGLQKTNIDNLFRGTISFEALQLVKPRIPLKLKDALLHIRRYTDYCFFMEIMWIKNKHFPEDKTTPTSTGSQLASGDDQPMEGVETVLTSVSSSEPKIVQFVGKAVKSVKHAFKKVFKSKASTSTGTQLASSGGDRMKGVETVLTSVPRSDMFKTTRKLSFGAKRPFPNVPSTEASTSNVPETGSSSPKFLKLEEFVFQDAPSSEEKKTPTSTGTQLASGDDEPMKGVETVLTSC